MPLELVPAFDTILNQKSAWLTQEEIQSPQVKDVISRMLDLAAGKGHTEQDSRQMVGLAAVQLGILKQIIAIDTTADGSNKQQDLLVLINPRILERSDEVVPGREGCWSCGNICGNVDRAKAVAVEALDREGAVTRLELSGFTSRIAQHEIDHLEGIRFPDRISLNEPQRLHLVEPAEFEGYRERWMDWPKVCPREKWEAMKSATSAAG